MAKKKTWKVKSERVTFFTFPTLHQDVLDTVSDEIHPEPWFNNNGSDQSSKREYSTNVMGTFRCDNGRCGKRGWSSKKVAILIRSYGHNGYDAVVFNQRCQDCKKLGVLTLDEKSYIERVAYRLKKWAGVATEKQFYEEKKGPPHKKELCEGCKQGYCQERCD